MRTGEVFALTWDDIDLENRIIKINKTVYAKDKEENGRWYLGTTKTIGSSREVYICDTLYSVLSDYKNLQVKYKKEYGKSPLSWTGNKTALTELIYALSAQGVFNNGNADIKLIAKVFENAFNIDLGDFYHTFMELKARKINRTKFLDSLCEALIKKKDEQDER